MINQEIFEWLNSGDIKPSGWLEVELSRALSHGLTGHLDALVPDLISVDDIYSTNRRSSSSHNSDQRAWWNSETQSNWWDGYIRSAFLVDYTAGLDKIDKHIRQVRASQDKDGYLGIYAADTRFNFSHENGELWAQTTLLRSLLGYYEFTHDENIFDVVVRCVKNTMRCLPMDRAHPFDVSKPSSGVCHGLTFTDILDRLYQLTGNDQFRRYANWLYFEYCRSALPESDIQLPNLINPDLNFSNHGVHTYEHFRPLMVAMLSSDDTQLKDAFELFKHKLKRCLCPSGAPIGDEYIAGRCAHPDTTGYEYCSIQELMDSSTHVIQKFGDSKFADQTEWLFFNAGQGSRASSGRAVCYLQTDNSLALMGSRDLNKAPNERRYKLSPTHKDVAVCCAPNAGRLFPYYVKAMWMRSKSGLAATLYGPCKLQTKLNDTIVEITEDTLYPFNASITFSLNLSNPMFFELRFRHPMWAESYEFGITQSLSRAPTQDYSLSNDGGWIVVKRLWLKDDRVNLKFSTSVKRNVEESGSYVSWGPLLFALPIAHREVEKQSYLDSAFYDSLCVPLDEHDCCGQSALRVDQILQFADQNFRSTESGDFSDWSNRLTLPVQLENTLQEKVQTATFVPFGSTLLRRCVF